MDHNASAAMAILDTLIQFTDQNPSQAANVPSLAESCNLSPGDADAAVAWLEARRAVRALQGADQPPYHYAAITLMPQGRNLFRNFSTNRSPTDEPLTTKTEVADTSIVSVSINRLRGINDGHLDEMTPLTVLVGPNGSGKSTVLEAISIAAASSDQDAFGAIWEQRPFVQDKVRWLRWRGLPDIEPTVSVITRSGLELSWKVVPRGPAGDIVRSAVGEGAGDTTALGRVYFLYSPAPNRPSRIAEEYSNATIRGGALQTVEMMQRLLGAYDVRILLEKDIPALFLSYLDYSIPVAAAGSGAEWLLHLGLGLVVPPGSLALVEEPELHLHPGGLLLAARAIWTAVRQRIQVVLTTHSLEFIDALVAESENDDELELLSIYRLNLTAGALLSSRIPGREVAFLRATIEEDLR